MKTPHSVPLAGASAIAALVAGSVMLAVSLPPRTLAFGVAGAALVWTALIHPFPLFLAALALIPTAGVGMSSLINLSLVNCLLLLLAPLGALRALTNRLDSLRASDWLTGLLSLFFLMAALLNGLTARDAAPHLRRIVTIIGLLALVACVLLLTRTVKQFDLALAAVALSAVAVSAIAFLQAIGVVGRIWGMGLIVGSRLSGLEFISYRTSGLFNGMGSFVIWTLAGTAIVALWQPAKGRRILKPIALILLLGGVLVAQTRGGWVAFAFLAVAYPLARFSRLLNRGTAFLLFFSPIMVAWLMVTLGANALQWASQPLIELNPISFHGRVDSYAVAYDMFLDKPLLGHGPHGFSDEFEVRYGVPKVVHNTFLSVLVSYGLAGLLPFLALIAGGIWRTSGVATDPTHPLSHHASALLLAAVGVFVEAQFYEAVADKALWLIIALLWAVAAVQSPRRYRTVSLKPALPEKA